MPRKEKDWERFREIRQLGSGAFGRTLLVADTSNNDEQVVIKVPHNEKTEEALVNELMQASALAANLAGMSHPNIVKFLGFAKFGGFYVMVLEYVPGRDLREELGPLSAKRRRPMEVMRAKTYIRSVCSGLAVAHGINLLHRDIKPENIRICEHGDTPKILDFGISKIVQSTGADSGTVAGTFPYMAPEALVGHACMASDIWSLNVTLYEMLTGQMPFWGDDVFQLKQKIDNETPVPPRELNPKVDERLNDLVLRGLNKNPKRRFESAQQMFDALSSEALDKEVENLRHIFQSGHEEEAEKLAIKLLERSQKEPRVYMLLAEFCNRRQQFHQTEAILRKGMQACPEHSVLHFYLAPALWNQGAAKERLAVAAMEQALTLGLSPTQDKQARSLLRTWKSVGGSAR